MISSMTGFARRQTVWHEGTVTVEIRSVNHRFLEVACRLPRTLNQMEETIKKAVQQRCTRGRVDVSVLLQGGKGKGVSISLDHGLAKQYHRALLDLKKSLKLPGKIDLALIAGLRDVVSLGDQPVEDPKLGKAVEKLVAQAVEDLEAMRKREGKALANDIRGRIEVIRKYRAAVQSRAPQAVDEAFERMKLRVQKLMEGDPPDLPRLHQELAIYADRADITEELVRLESHMVQFDQQLNRAESVGKTLDFLVQEMGREINTIGSKANDAAITASVVSMKAELERIKEQVQNVE